VSQFKRLLFLSGLCVLHLYVLCGKRLPAQHQILGLDGRWVKNTETTKTPRKCSTKKTENCQTDPLPKIIRNNCSQAAPIYGKL